MPPGPLRRRRRRGHGRHGRHERAVRVARRARAALPSPPPSPRVECIALRRSARVENSVPEPVGAELILPLRVMTTRAPFRVVLRRRSAEFHHEAARDRRCSRRRFRARSIRPSLRSARHTRASRVSDAPGRWSRFSCSQARSPRPTLLYRACSLRRVGRVENHGARAGGCGIDLRCA